MSFNQIAIDILNDDLHIMNGLIVAYMDFEYRRRSSVRRHSVNPINRNRQRQGYYHNLVAEMRLNDNKIFANFHRMTREAFDELLSIVGPSIQRQNVGERSITAGERLSLTIRYLASGDSMVSLGKYGYRIGQSTTFRIIRETCLKLWLVLKDTVFPKQSCTIWKDIARDFEDQSNFPHCLGAMDGKHVIIQSFSNSGSTHFNYKHSHSVVLFAISDANYKFIMVEIRAPGHLGDSTIFRNSCFGRAILRGGDDLNLPPQENLKDGNKYPYVFIGDEAFPLLCNLMRPYPGRNASVLPADVSAFNYRLSRARRVVENAFGILASRWRIYRRPILASKITVLSIIKATVVLHNWLRAKKIEEYYSAELIDRYMGGTCRPGTWRDEHNTGLQEIRRIGSNNHSTSATEIRNQFKTYLNEHDILPWQYTPMKLIVLKNV